MKDTCTIYLLTNTVNGKQYVGQTWLKLYQRSGGSEFPNYVNSKHLYNAIQKHTPKNFQYSIIAECDTQEEANETEIYFIEFYDTINSGYNIKEGGSVGRQSQATKEKIRKTQQEKADKWTLEERMERAKPIIGWWLGKVRGPHTEEWKEENSKRMVEWHANNPHPMLGKHHTVETRASQRVANLGRPTTETQLEARRKPRRTPAADKALMDDYSAGMATLDLCEKHIVGTNTIERVRKRMNIPKRTPLNKIVGLRSHTEETLSKQTEAAKKVWANRKAIKDQND